MRRVLLLTLLLAGCDATETRPVSSDGVRHGAGAPAPAGSVGRGSRTARTALGTEPADLDPRAGARGYRDFCAVCHGATGLGDGPVIARGFTVPRSFGALSAAERERRRTVAIITNGYGTMLSQADQIAPAERWAIAAHVETLSQDAADAR